MAGRILRVALAVILVVTSLPASVFAQQASGAQSEQSERAQPSGPARGLEGLSGPAIEGIAYTMYALEGISPKPSSANEK